MKPDGQVISATAGLNASMASPKYTLSLAATNYTAPLQLGKYWTLGMGSNLLLFTANQLCAEFGH
jgi:hypothetical protein